MKKQPTLTLDREKVITAVFAFRNYIAQLKEEIKAPKRPTGASESAMALTDAQPLLAEMEQWLERLKPVRTLTCACCGARTQGRQWPNRDTGYGMCLACITLVRKRGMKEEEVHNLYGVAGIHWGVEV